MLVYCFPVGNDSSCAPINDVTLQQVFFYQPLRLQSAVSSLITENCNLYPAENTSTAIFETYFEFSIVCIHFVSLLMLHAQ